MALPTSATIQAAVSDVFAALKEYPLKRNARSGVGSLGQVTAVLAEAYRSFDSSTVTGANLSALFPNLEADKGNPLEAGDIFKVPGAEDTTDTALATAKGSAPVAGDLFVITAVGTPAVGFVGQTPDFSTEGTDDFISIGA